MFYVEYLHWVADAYFFTFKDCTLENTCNVIQGQLYVIGLVVGTRMHFKIIANKTGNWTQCQVTPKIL